ncbi:hypothetical protein L1F30_06225 [Simiduia sp. 21SJ11W-1]|uniref:hypothetical protein n=1 Tax=Simiduia sp. 21SJ11W-1 TaxID=2909669 RepID=UPI00209CCCC0|nr:hypothetical protein [Simiduia sp. 21SJ11W-1]UTA49139.1 hypothetical protein L1F30_06225 [Simiduia sp. 21SJ11W-1]
MIKFGGPVCVLFTKIRFAAIGRNGRTIKHRVDHFGLGDSETAIGAGFGCSNPAFGCTCGFHKFRTGFFAVTLFVTDFFFARASRALILNFASTGEYRSAEQHHQRKEEAAGK